MMHFIFTIGTGNRTGEEFMARLVKYKIDYLIDIRRAHCRSWNHAFAWDNIAVFLEDHRGSSHGATYSSFPLLSKPKPMTLAEYKQWIEHSGKHNIEALANDIIELNITRPALMCSELHAYFPRLINGLIATEFTSLMLLRGP